MSAIKQAYYKQIQNQQHERPGLAREIFQNDAIMVVAFSHFGGQYPQHDHKKTCKTYWSISGRGHKAEKVAPFEQPLWRGYTMDSGMLEPPCEHCRNERVLSFCKKIERAANVYKGENLMRYQVMSEKEAKKTADRIRKRNQRSDEVYTFYTTFPLENSVIFLHDASDIDGTALPTDRAALYDLVGGWVLNTPKGKRAGHGLGTWGIIPAEIDQERDKKKGKGKQDQDQAAGERWRIIGQNYGKLALSLSAHLDERIPASGAKLDLDLSELIDLLDKQNIDWTVYDGQLPENVTLNRYTPEDTSAKCDNEGHKGHEGERKVPVEQPLTCWDLVIGGKEWRP